MAGACLLRAYVGADVLHAYTHDVFVALDGGWRVLNGQRSNIDFFNDMGPLFYLLMAAGLKLSHGSAAGLGWAQGIASSVVGLWALWLGRRRLPPLMCALFCLFVFFTAIAPYDHGESIARTAPGMIYNRIGYSLMALAMLEAAFESQRASSGADVVDGVSSGLVLGLALFLKITFFVFAGFILLALFFCRPQRRARWLGIAAGFLVVLLCATVYYGGDLMPMLRDLWIVRGAKHIRWRWYAVEALYFSVAPMILFVWFAKVQWKELKAGSGRSIVLIGVATVVVGYLSLLTNYQFDAMPLNAVGAILILQAFAARGALRGHTSAAAMLTAWGALFIVVPIALDSASLAWAGIQKARFANNSWYHFAAPRLWGVTSFDRKYIEEIDNGTALLQKNAQPGDTVTCLDFSNPFSFALGLAPAPGGTSDLQFGTNFDYRHRPDPAWLFGRARLLMWPAAFTDPTLYENAPAIFGPYVLEHFHLVDESSAWKLYRRDD